MAASQLSPWTHLASHQLLGHLDGGLTEGSAVLGTHLCANIEEGRIIAVGLVGGGGGDDQVKATTGLATGYTHMPSR